MEHPEIERLLRIADPDNPEDINRLKKLLYRTGMFAQRFPLVLPYPPQYSSWIALIICDPSSSEYHLPIHGPGPSEHEPGEISRTFSAQGIFVPVSSGYRAVPSQSRVNDHEILPYNRDLAKWLLEHFGVGRAGLSVIEPEEEAEATKALGSRNFLLNPGWIPCRINTELELAADVTHYYSDDFGLFIQNILPFHGRFAVLVNSSVLPRAEFVQDGPLIKELFKLLRAELGETYDVARLGENADIKAMGEILWGSAPDVSDVFPGAQSHNPVLQYSIGDDEE